jgi:hypothetical protein
MSGAFESHPCIFTVNVDVSIAKTLSFLLQMHVFDAIANADPRTYLARARAIEITQKGPLARSCYKKAYGTRFADLTIAASNVRA